MTNPVYSYWRYYRKNHHSADCRLCGSTLQMGNKASTGGLYDGISLYFHVITKHLDCSECDI
jgi:hypothetical protein